MRRIARFEDLRRCCLAWSLSVASACAAEEPTPEAQEVVAPRSCEGDGLFGRPNERTGLTAEQCRPECGSGESAWTAVEATPALLDELAAFQLLEPYVPLTSDPYRESPEPIDADAVCAVLLEPGSAHQYRLRTHASFEAASAAGGIVTHYGPCGLCSPLFDLRVYLRENDLTQPVRQCALDHFAGTQAEHTACLMRLGFDEACASIWYYNTIHTRSLCIEPCLAALNAPYHLPNGDLNACLQCDEDQSGAVFKALAGRTRRNSGLANAMCRPRSEARPLDHDYSAR
jgi:hypothetical protein